MLVTTVHNSNISSLNNGILLCCISCSTVQQYVLYENILNPHKYLHTAISSYVELCEVRPLKYAHFVYCCVARTEHSMKDGELTILTQRRLFGFADRPIMLRRG